MCGSLPPPSPSGQHLSGKAAGPLLQLLGGLVMVVVLVVVRLADLLTRRHGRER